MEHRIASPRRGPAVAKSAQCGDNLKVAPSARATTNRFAGDDPFRPGTLVIATLSNPREKFWGAILTLRTEGLSLCGIELPSFEDLVSMVKQDEPFSPGVVFFPMHRVERLELDLPDGNLPSLAQRFTISTGVDPMTVFTARETLSFPQERS